MNGITDLTELLKSMSPELAAERYVYCTFPDGRYGDHRELHPFAAVAESEGLTLIIPQARADAHHLPYRGVFRRITLKVHSSLEAVGLTAAFSQQLAAQGISANVIAGYFHDHIFVPEEDAERALAALQQLAR